jgi:putative cardiolipin synthase
LFASIPSIFTAAVLTVALLGGCASLPPGSDYHKTESRALAHPEQTRLGRRFEAEVRKHAGKAGFRLLPVGIDGFLTRAQMINAAERTLDVQYFIFQEDETGKLLTGAMLRAADRGVRVRILIDDLEASGRDAQIAALDTHPNIEIRLFNPFGVRGDAKFLRLLEFATNASRLDYRMHNKLFVADNAIALVGGRNVGDEYFQVNSEWQFGDYDVFVAGPIVKQLSGTFDDYWQSALAIPVRALATEKPSDAALEGYRKSLDEHRRQIKSNGTDYMRQVATGEPLAGMLSGRVPLVWAHAQVVCDSPEKKRVEKGEMVGKLMHRPVAAAAEAVKTELLIVSPYFIPGDDGMQLFKDLRKRGVRVRVLTNSLESTDKFGPLMAYAGYSRYRVPLLEAGVELYEVRPVLGRPNGSGGKPESEHRGRFALHAKIFLFDRKRMFIGSMNFDQRSMRLNTEIGLIIDSPELARQSVARFESIAQPANSYVLALRPDDTGGAPHLVWRTRVDGKAVEYDSVPARGAWKGAVGNILSLLPFDDEL